MDPQALFGYVHNDVFHTHRMPQHQLMPSTSDMHTSCLQD